MPHVFALRADRVAYQALELEFSSITRHIPNSVNFDDVTDFSKKNISMASWWKTPEAKFSTYQNCGSLIPDISLWIGASLVLSPLAYGHLRNILKPSGELLPVKVGPHLFYIFNCLVFGEEDENKCEIYEHEGMEYGLKQLVFKECVRYPLVFKSAIEGCVSLFCGDQFKSFVESYRLKGIFFDANLVEVF